jgi:hypothetical protein
VTLGLVVGLGASEALFRSRDHGAFPHLNLYAPDAELGVRLLPGESMKLAFGGNPVTGVRINGAGLRGAEPGPPGGDEVLVIGDSQVFGLGVEEGETASARLEGLLGGARVINAGVPTYGPPEYEKVLARQLQERKPKRVVYVVNMANDLFEAERPNSARHTVWDGWAVRKETAPTTTANFPGREVLFRKSHAVFALRRWWYLRDSPVETFSTPSEGTFRDIGEAAARAAEEHLRTRNDTRRLLRLQEAKTAVADAEVNAARASFMALLSEQSLDVKETAKVGYGDYKWDPIAASFAKPGDIVGSQDFGEWGRPINATAALILQGAEARRKIEAILRERALGSSEKAAKINPVLDEVAGSQKRVDALRAEPLPRIRAWSPLAPSIRRAKAMCDAAGARLLVAILPLDVQVSPDEWAKYGQASVDLAPSRILFDDLIDTAADVGAETIDLTPALQAAEPGAFLKGDLHMTPKGHEAMARALAAVLSAPPASRPLVPQAGRPLGRTPPTSLVLVRTRNEVLVPGSTAAGCETYIVDEWLTLRCHGDGVDRSPPLGVKVRSAPLNESVVYLNRNSHRHEEKSAVVVQVPVMRGVVTKVDFRWPKRSRRLDTVWDGSKVTTSFHALPDEQASDIPDLVAPRPEACKVLADAGEKQPCDELLFFDNPDCFTTYKEDGPSLAACLVGNRSTPPSCPRGQAPVGVFQRCLPLCGKDTPCKTGTCTAYEGGEVCL